MTENTKKDITYLIQYKGGGYSGCHWEWNYAVVRNPAIHKTSFYDVASSGSMARKTVSDLRGIIKDGAYIYNCNDADSMLDFIESCNPEHVKDAFIWLYDNLGIEVYPICPICKNETDSQDMILGDFSGDGGIGVTAHSWHCITCDSDYLCDSCKEFDLTAKKRDENDFLCDTCYVQKIEEAEAEQLKNEKNRIEHFAFQNGLVLSAWYNFHGGIACDCTLTGKKFTIGANIVV